MFWRKRYRSILYEVTQRCNLNCLYCYNVWKSGDSYPPGELSTAESMELLDRVIKQTGCRLITLTGGEPLLRGDIVEIVRFCRSRGVAVNLITNGTLLTETKTLELVEAGVTYFEIPLLSIHQDIYIRLTGSKDLRQVIDAIGNVTAAGGKVAVVFVATKINLPDWPDVMQLAAATGAVGVMFNRFNPGGEGLRHIEELLPGKDELESALACADRMTVTLSLPVACSVPIQPCIVDIARFRNISFGFCPLGTPDAYFTIDPTGNLRACNHSPAILGNLGKDDFHSIASGKEAGLFARAMPAGCLSCRKAAKCRGGCKAAALACSASAYVEEPFLAAQRTIKYPEAVS
jgi:radical SAM protein with 4Fe4S-binding SPASM domain